ncbi:MAG: hypothetical protein FJW37_07090 [Acidobacteria bacterium]|nr:hypothetical protein [Acidobacteriota bacterium]
MAGVSCACLIFSTTFDRRAPLRECAVRIWGFRGPLGAFIAAWGGIAMLTSAPFDDWWHNAYGLDVKILSPPHTVLAAGMIAVEAGSLILILGQMNRAAGEMRERLERMFLYVAGMMVVGLMALLLEYTYRVLLHTGRTYRVIATVIPLVLAGVSRASGRRWPATTVAGVYTAFLVALVWILPRFAAEPKLGPVYYQVKQFVPNGFPILLLAPALALDLLWRRTPDWNRWALAAVSGAVFVAVLVTAQWPFADFLMSPGARNWVFGAHYFDYDTRPDSYIARSLFYPLETPAQLRFELALAVAAATLSARAGLGWGEWMRRIRR